MVPAVAVSPERGYTKETAKTAAAGPNLRQNTSQAIGRYLAPGNISDILYRSPHANIMATNKPGPCGTRNSLKLTQSPMSTFQSRCGGGFTDAPKSRTPLPILQRVVGFRTQASFKVVYVRDSLSMFFHPSGIDGMNVSDDGGV